MLFFLSLEHKLQLRILCRSSFRVALRFEVSSEAEEMWKEETTQPIANEPAPQIFSVHETPAEIVRPRKVKAELKVKFEREDLE